MSKTLFFYILFSLFSLGAAAQQTDRDFVRRGNSLYKDSLFIKAEENYLKALDKNQSSSNATYNLGNAYLEQQKAKEAADQYKEAIALMELNKEYLIESGVTDNSSLKEVKEHTSKAYHNLGVIFQASQDYQNAISAYQHALRNNPYDHETRYNLALCMNQLKQQQEEQQQEPQEQNKDDDREDKQEKNNDNPKEQPQQDEQRQNISRENAEQLLQAAMQDEKEVQERIRRAIQVQQKKQLDKDW